MWSSHGSGNKGNKILPISSSSTSSEPYEKHQMRRYKSRLAAQTRRNKEASTLNSLQKKLPLNELQGNLEISEILRLTFVSLKVLTIVQQRHQVSSITLHSKTTTTSTTTDHNNSQRLSNSAARVSHSGDSHLRSQNWNPISWESSNNNFRPSSHFISPSDIENHAALLIVDSQNTIIYISPNLGNRLRRSWINLLGESVTSLFHENNNNNNSGGQTHNLFVYGSHQPRTGQWIAFTVSDDLTQESRSSSPPPSTSSQTCTTTTTTHQQQHGQQQQQHSSSSRQSTTTTTSRLGRTNSVSIRNPKRLIASGKLSTQVNISLWYQCISCSAFVTRSQDLNCEIFLLLPVTLTSSSAPTTPSHNTTTTTTSKRQHQPTQPPKAATTTKSNKSPSSLPSSSSSSSSTSSSTSSLSSSSNVPPVGNCQFICHSPTPTQPTPTIDSYLNYTWTSIDDSYALNSCPSPGGGSVASTLTVLSEPTNKDYQHHHNNNNNVTMWNYYEITVNAKAVINNVNRTMGQAVGSTISPEEMITLDHLNGKLFIDLLHSQDVVVFTSAWSAMLKAQADDVKSIRAQQQISSSCLPIVRIKNLIPNNNNNDNYSKFKNNATYRLASIQWRADPMQHNNNNKHHHHQQQQLYIIHIQLLDDEENQLVCKTMIQRNNNNNEENYIVEEPDLSSLLNTLDGPGGAIMTTTTTSDCPQSPTLSDILWDPTNITDSSFNSDVNLGEQISACFNEFTNKWMDDMILNENPLKNVFDDINLDENEFPGDNDIFLDDLPSLWSSSPTLALDSPPATPMPLSMMTHNNLTMIKSLPINNCHKRRWTLSSDQDNERFLINSQKLIKTENDLELISSSSSFDLTTTTINNTNNINTSSARRSRSLLPLDLREEIKSSTRPLCSNYSLSGYETCSPTDSFTQSLSSSGGGSSPVRGGVRYYNLVSPTKSTQQQNHHYVSLPSTPILTSPQPTPPPPPPPPTSAAPPPPPMKTTSSFSNFFSSSSIKFPQTTTATTTSPIVVRPIILSRSNSAIVKKPHAVTTSWIQPGKTILIVQSTTSGSRTAAATTATTATITGNRRLVDGNVKQQQQQKFISTTTTTTTSSSSDHLLHVRSNIL